MAVERRGLGLAGWAATFVPCMSQALMPDMRSQGTALLQSAYSTQPLMAAQFDPMTGIQMPPQQPQMFLQPTSLQVPSMSAMQMQPDLTPSDGNLRGMAMPQIPALAPMYQPYQPYQPSWLYPSWQMQPQNFYRQDLVLQEQLSSMNKELQSLKQQEQKEAKDLELKAEQKMKEWRGVEHDAPCCLLCKFAWNPKWDSPREDSTEFVGFVVDRFR
ncbi:unnamed protein product [Effrenium voratum]|nr:unnamed protein product [Effrenium voratum]